MGQDAHHLGETVHLRHHTQCEWFRLTCTVQAYANYAGLRERFRLTCTVQDYANGSGIHEPFMLKKAKER
jgi:hypothetical protein